MLKFKEFITEAGATSGQLELHKTDVEVAYAYAQKMFTKHGRDVDEQIPNFKKNYIFAKNHASDGKTQRKDMPVIDNKDISDFQDRLKTGKLDINNPYSSDTNPNKKYPEHLDKKKAHKFLNAGRKDHDGSRPDDKVKVIETKSAVKSLFPIQKQIYVDKSIDVLAKLGVEASSKFMQTKTKFVTSSDLQIIDGHHRYLSSLLANPDIKVTILKIDLPMKELLKVSLAYGDAVGNKRNA